MTNTDQLREQIAVYVAALASSGDNFRVAGELEPISQKVKDDYINSFLLLIEREIARAVRAARIDEREKAIIEAQIEQRETEKADVWDSAEELNAYKSAIRDVVLDHGDRLDALNKGESNE